MSKIKFTLTMLLAACFLSLGVFAIAQETEPMPISEEAMQDMEITAEDLDAKSAIILPDSIFHPLKRLGRNFMEVITFDPVKDAELKLQHANQELSEMKQLIDKEGIENVDRGDLINSIEWFEGKMEKIKDASETLKEEKNDNLAGVETLLNDLTDKQFKEHKVLENFHEDIIEHKEAIPDAENIFADVKDKQEDALKRFGEILTAIDEPERIPDRLSSVADSQEGSDFKLIKATEILEKLEEKVPDQAKEAIEKAQEMTFEKLQEDVSKLPPIVRAEKFEDYSNAIRGDETIQLGIFERIKQLPDIPQDILEKIEEVKEFAVKRFEDKIEKIEAPEVQEKLFEDLDGNDLDDIMALEELKAKITAKQQEIKNKVDKKHEEGIAAFKKQFTDAQSQTQAKRFERLLKEMTANPNVKTLRLINELEDEVSEDPKKKEFIMDIKTKTKTEFENKFRQEGERFFDRMATFNPEDMMTYKEFEQEQFFDPRMIEQFFDYQTAKYKEHVQGIDSPEMFNRFDERMRFAPTEVIDIIKTRDSEFGDVMQFKARKMMEAELELKEREMQMAMERSWRENEDDFQIQLRQVQNDEEKANLYDQRREQDLALMKKEFEERKAIMEARFANDPFCNAMCQEIQRTYLEQDMANREWHLQEDARMREFQLEMEIKNQTQYDPFAGKCYDPRSCMDYCSQNPSAPGCGGMGQQMPVMTTMVGNQQYPMTTTTMGPPPCPEGQINMPTGPNQWVCRQDPYYRPPEVFKQCPPGKHWNEAKGFCEFDASLFQTMPAIDQTQPYPMEQQMPQMAFCGPGQYWDNMRGCVQENFQKCQPGEYFDFYEQRCIADKWQSCPPGEYWDPGRNSCIRDVVNQVQTCEVGQFYDFYKRECVVEHFPVQCGPNEYWDEGVRECRPLTGAQPACPPGQYWNPTENRCIGNVIDTSTCPSDWTPVCGVDNITYMNDCHAKQNGMAIQYRGQCAGIDAGMACNRNNVCEYNETIQSCPEDCGTSPAGCSYYYNGNDCANNGCIWCSDTNACYDSNHSCSYMTECNNDGRCDYNENLTSCPNDCGSTETICNNNNVCDNGETAATCPSECGGTTPGICPSTIFNNYTTGYTCNYANCPNGCIFDYNGCPNACMTTGTCPTNSYTTSAGACDFTTCPNGCVFDNTGCPSSCMTSVTCNNDNICNNGETSYSCPSDCGTVPTTCATNSYTTSAGACNYTTCPNGCNFSNGCPTSCMTESTVFCDTYTDSANCESQGCVWCTDTNVCRYSSSVCGTTFTCPSNSYTTSAGACDFTTCPNGCMFDNTGCPSSCTESTSGTCPSTMYNDYTTGYVCSSTACPNGCEFDYNGCPNACMTSGTTGGGCEAYSDSASCYADSACGIWCEGESTPYSCFSPGHTCSASGGTTDCYSLYDSSACSSAGCVWCTVPNTCNSQGFTCPSPSCSSLYDSSSCSSNGCTWCDSDWTCHDSGYTCTVSCSSLYDSSSCSSNGCTWCDSDYMCHESGFYCAPAAGGCDYNQICDYNETMETCPEDCPGTPSANLFGGIKIFFQRLFGF